MITHAQSKVTCVQRKKDHVLLHISTNLWFWRERQTERIYICIYVCINIYICMCLYPEEDQQSVYTCVYICIYVYVCIYVYISRLTYHSGLFWDDNIGDRHPTGSQFEHTSWAHTLILITHEHVRSIAVYMYMTYRYTDLHIYIYTCIPSALWTHTHKCVLLRCTYIST